MKFFDIHHHPDAKQLRQFGIICLFALPLLGWLWGGNSLIIGVLATIGVAMAAIATVLPNFIKPVFLAMTFVTAPIGIVVSEVTMFFVYYAVLSPIGIFFRFMKRDPLQRKFEHQAKTYWQPKDAPRNASSYYRQS